MLLTEDPSTVRPLVRPCLVAPLPCRCLPQSNRKCQLISHTINNFNIGPDKQAVARVNESLSALQQARGLRIREAEGALKSMFKL